MRIVVDARAYFMRTGMGRYTRAMVKALVQRGSGHEWRLLISDHHVPGDVGWLGPSVSVQVSRAPWLGCARERRQLEAETAAWRGDRFYSIFPPVAVTCAPSVVTVFDLIPWTHAELLPSRVVRRFRVAAARALPRASRIVAISQATAHGIQQHCPELAHRTVVAPCGVSEELAADPSCRVDAPRHGVLFVGTIEPRKNVPAIVEAARQLPGVAFTLVGKSGWGSYDLASAIQALPNVTWLPHVDDRQLTALYRQAAVFVYPSRVEGFGLPVLEALEHGALPIVSRDPALREIVPDDDLVVDAVRPGELARTISVWLENPVARNARVELLRMRAGRFTWGHGADVVLQALETVR